LQMRIEVRENASLRISLEASSAASCITHYIPRFKGSRAAAVKRGPRLVRRTSCPTACDTHCCGAGKSASRREVPEQDSTFQNRDATQSPTAQPAGQRAGQRTLQTMGPNTEQPMSLCRTIAWLGSRTLPLAVLWMCASELFT